MGPNVSVSMRVSAMIDSLCPFLPSPARGVGRGLASFAIGRRDGRMAARYPPPLDGEGREGVVLMRMCSGIRRHVCDMAVAYAALGDDVIRECLHLGAPASEHSDLKTAVVIEMDMERCLRKAMMRVEILGQALGQLARGVVVDIAQGGDAIAVMRHFEV